MFCSHCGKQNSDDGSFCIRCGQSLQKLPATPDQKRPGTPEASGKSGSPFMENPAALNKPSDPSSLAGHQGVSGHKGRAGLIIAISVGSLVVIAALLAVFLWVIPALNKESGDQPADTTAAEFSLLGFWVNEDIPGAVNFESNRHVVVYSGDDNTTGTYEYDDEEEEGVIFLDSGDLKFSVSGDVIDFDGTGDYKRVEEEDFDVQEFMEENRTPGMTTDASGATTMAAPTPILTKTPDEENAIYNSYILNTLIPEYGLAKITPIVETFEWTAQCSVEIPPIPQENKGILSCVTEDLDNDGSLEMLMTNAGTSTEADQQYQGVGIHIYALQDGAVYEIPFLRPENSYPDELTYNLEEYYQVSIVDNGQDRYIFISNYRNWPGEGLWFDDFEYSFYQVTDEGAKCLDYIQVDNGIISDLLVKTGAVTPVYKEVYNAWADSSAENLFSKIKEYFDKYGVDGSWLKPYYDNLGFFADEYGNITSSTAIENLVRPISEMALNINTVTSVYGTEELFATNGTQTYTITDYTNIRAELGMDSAVGKQNLPLPEQSRTQAVANSDIETEVLHVREIWNTCRANIESGVYTKTDLGDGVIAYSDGSYIVTIEAPAGYGGSEYARIYTYENGVLIFAFFSKDSEEDRLYIKSNQLYRWRYTVGSNDPINRDNNADNELFLLWERIAIEEGNRLLLLANG